MIGAEKIVRTLEDGGIDVCFANPGTSEMHFVAALEKTKQTRCVLGLFEGVATGAADGFYRMAQRPAVTLLHLGPGLANGVANLHNAKKATSGIVNLVGEHATYHIQHNAPLMSDIEGIASPVSHWVRRTNGQQDLANDTAAAVSVAGAAAGRIATLIVPADISWMEADGEPTFQLAAFVLRSPHAHATIRGIQTTAALESSGVVAIYTEADLRADGIGPLPCIASLGADGHLTAPPRFALARERVRHVGDPVVLIVAETVEAAVEASELVEVDYDTLPVLASVPTALETGASQMWDEAVGNIAFTFQKGDRSKVEACFASAAHSVEASLFYNRVAAAALEPRAAIGWHDESTGVSTLMLSGQGVHNIRQQLAGPVFHLPESVMNLIAPDVGGGFGMKGPAYPEWVLTLWAARRLRRPVKWVADRSEEFLNGVHARDITTKARLALDESGKILALAAELTANAGAYVSAYGPLSSTAAAATAMGGIYAIPEIFMDVRGVLTNTAPTDVYRGAGKPEANYIIERMIDIAARRCGFDAIELRQRNAIDSFPYRASLGMTITTARFRANIDDAVETIDRVAFEQRRSTAAAAGRLRGLGLSCFLETARGAPGEGAEVKFGADGTVELLVGTESNGQGHETTFIQLASARLGLPFELFRCRQADTSQIRTGRGHGGARSMHMGGEALMQALEAMMVKAQGLAGQLLQVDPDDLYFADGRFTHSADARSIALLDVAAAVRRGEVSADGDENGLDTFVMNDSDAYTFPSGCHIAEVEIDPQTGELRIERYLAVDDYGTLINPSLVEGQVHGGVTQGIGTAVCENIVYGETGQLLTGSLMGYRLPRADDLPNFDVQLKELPTDANSLGVKGSGQAGTIAAAPTIVNAVVDALSPLGIDTIDMPLTSANIWQAIRSATGNS